MTTTESRVKRPHGLETQRALLVAAGAVFSRVAYAEARLKDIADEAGISQGALYFHFGNKDDVARAVLEAQQERMGDVLTRAYTTASTGLARVLAIFEGLAELVASDELVQAGIRLSMQPSTGLELDTAAPYEEWVDMTEKMVLQGMEDGSIDRHLNARETAELLNEIFVGSQTLAGLRDKWASLPRRIAAVRPQILLLLTGASAE